MALALTPERKFNYVLKSDRNLPVEQQTVWHLRALTVVERDQIVGMLTRAVKHGTSGYVASKADAIRCGLEGWTNLMVPGGAPAEFVSGPPRNHPWIKRSLVITDECLERIPYEYWDELSDAIIECNRLTEEDRGN